MRCAEEGIALFVFHSGESTACVIPTANHNYICDENMDSQFGCKSTNASVFIFLFLFHAAFKIKPQVNIDSEILSISSKFSYPDFLIIKMSSYMKLNSSNRFHNISSVLSSFSYIVCVISYEYIYNLCF